MNREAIFSWISVWPSRPCCAYFILIPGNDELALMVMSCLMDFSDLPFRRVGVTDWYSRIVIPIVARNIAMRHYQPSEHREVYLRENPPGWVSVIYVGIWRCFVIIYL